MHAYATDAKDRESIPLWLAAFAVAAALALSSVLKFLKWEVPWWVDAPSVMGFYGFFYYLFDNFIWSYQLGKFSFSSIPNLKGTWVGVIHSSYNDTDYDGIVLYVHQTWSSVSVQLQTMTSSSRSTMASINTLDSSESTLKYEYMNEPTARSLQTMAIHRGTANMRLSPDGLSLEGDYFTGRGRQTFGDMRFKLMSRDRITRDKALEKYSKSVTP